MPIKEIDEKISKLLLNQNNTDQVNSLKILLKDKIKEIYSNLSRWQKYSSPDIQIGHIHLII